MSPEKTPTGIPIIRCERCGLDHPEDRSHCHRCGAASAFIDRDSGYCITCRDSNAFWDWYFAGTRGIELR